MNAKMKKTGVSLPVILLPQKGIDLSKWSVVACDQYTSQRECWLDAERCVGNSESTLHLIFPEVYLEDADTEERIQNINRTMKKYLDENILVPQKPGFVYVDRKTSHTASRKGLILAVDLEKYDYTRGSQTLIRATEGTVLDRLPPRIKIRENAPIEVPHIMLLIDDEEKTVIEPLSEKLHRIEKLYDFDLMMDGGHITGWKIDDDETIEGILSALDALATPEIFSSRYGAGPDKGVLLFAAGDGNHSLATAKAHWENLKKNLSPEETESHPARFALVEVVNVHDDGLKFEPIHRVVFNVSPRQVIDRMVQAFNASGSSASYRSFETKEAMFKEAESLRKDKSSHILPYTTCDGPGFIAVSHPKFTLEVGTLQSFLDELVRADNSIKIDYIHGEDVVDSLGSKEGNMGFYLPPMDKQDLFRTVIFDGVLPRKTFSMGESEEKRFYLECRKICKD